MQDRHVITFYLAWDENRLGQEERRAVQQHLAECKSCKDYFEKMSALLKTTDPSLLPTLEADPFLPTRIRALANGSAAAADAKRAQDRPPAASATAGEPGGGIALTVPGRKLISWVRLSLAGVATVVAVVSGIYLGKGIAVTQQENGDTAIVTAYYNAVAQNGFAGDWGDVIEEEEGQE